MQKRLSRIRTLFRSRRREVRELVGERPLPRHFSFSPFLMPFLVVLSFVVFCVGGWWPMKTFCAPSFSVATPLAPFQLQDVQEKMILFACSIKETQARKQQRDDTENSLSPLKKNELKKKVFSFVTLKKFNTRSRSRPPPRVLLQSKLVARRTPSHRRRHRRHGLLDGQGRPHEHLDAAGDPDSQPTGERRGQSRGILRRKTASLFLTRRPNRDPPGEARDANVEPRPAELDDARDAESSSGVDGLPPEGGRGSR